MPDRLILHLCLIRRRRRRLNTIIRVNKCLERRDLGRGKFGILKNDVGKSSVYPSVDRPDLYLSVRKLNCIIITFIGSEVYYPTTSSSQAPLYEKVLLQQTLIFV